MNQIDKISKEDYIALKNFAYCAYGFYRRASKEIASSYFQGCMNKYHTEEEKTILANTLICPFDIELQQAFSNNKATIDNIKLICDKFNITPEIIEQKLIEYHKYDYAMCVGDGSLNYNIIFELSKEFVENGQIAKKI